MKKKMIFFLFLLKTKIIGTRLIEAVLTSTQNLCFRGCKGYKSHGRVIITIIIMIIITILFITFIPTHFLYIHVRCKLETSFVFNNGIGGERCSFLTTTISKLKLQS